MLRASIRAHNKQRGDEMRIFKWIGIACVPVIFVVAYMFLSAYRSGLWLDHEFAELSQNWDAAVVLRNTRTTGNPSDDSLQTALNDFKQARLEQVTPAACSHGFKADTQEGFDLRSQCLIWARFDKGGVRFEVELKRIQGQWKYTGFAFYPQASAP